MKKNLFGQVPGALFLVLFVCPFWLHFWEVSLEAFLGHMDFTDVMACLAMTTLLVAIVLASVAFYRSGVVRIRRIVMVGIGTTALVALLDFGVFVVNYYGNFYAVEFRNSDAIADAIRNNRPLPDGHRVVLREHVPQESWRESSDEIFVIARPRAKHFWRRYFDVERDGVYTNDEVLDLLVPQDFVAYAQLIAPQLPNDEEHLADLKLRFLRWQFPEEVCLVLLMEKDRDHAPSYAMEEREQFLYIEPLIKSRRKKEWVDRLESYAGLLFPSPKEVPNLGDDPYFQFWRGDMEGARKGIPPLPEARRKFLEEKLNVDPQLLQDGAWRFAHDFVALRKRDQTRNDTPLQVTRAANRVFNNIKFVGKTPVQVKQMLGEPAQVNEQHWHFRFQGDMEKVEFDLYFDERGERVMLAQ